MTQKLETILKVMHRRWLIENNGFRVLKDRYNMDHCYVGEINAIRLINEIIMLVFNLVNMYVNIRTKGYRERGTTMRALKKIFEKQINEDRKIYLLLQKKIQKNKTKKKSTKDYIGGKGELLCDFFKK